MSRHLFRWLVLLSFAVSGCASAPNRPSGIGLLVSEQEELMATAILKERAKLFRHMQEQRLIAIGTKLLAQMEDLPPFTLKVIDGEEINAYTSNGSIRITLAMMRFLKDDDELAVIVGHELGHLKVEHSGTLLGGSSPKDLEREADLYGLIYVYKAGYDVRAAARLWSRMAVELSGVQTRQWPRTHPTFAERVVMAQKIAQELLASGVTAGGEIEVRLIKELREKAHPIQIDGSQDPEPVRSLRLFGHPATTPSITPPLSHP